MTAKKVMRLWEVAGLCLKTRIFKPFRDKKARTCVVGEKRGGVEGKREGSFNINVPLYLEYTLAPIPLPFFLPVPYRVNSTPACHPGQKEHNIVNNN